MANNPKDLIGQDLGGYRLERMLGAGGMGAVFLGKKPDGTVVAVKVLSLPWQSTDADVADFCARFRREAQVLLGLTHPAIPRILGFGEDGDNYFLVLQYIDGGTLADRLAHGPLSFNDAARMIGQIASALDYAHSQKMVHRDVKPTNVLLDGQGNAYLADFSIVQILGGMRTKLTATGFAVGTPEYMSPEQSAGDAVAPSSDIYNLGLLAYAMVTGHPPFEGGSAVQLGIKHMQVAPIAPRTYRNDLPVGAEAAIMRALVKSPVQRFNSAGEFARAFHGGLQGTWQSTTPMLSAVPMPPPMPMGSTVPMTPPPTMRTPPPTATQMTPPPFTYTPPTTVAPSPPGASGSPRPRSSLNPILIGVTLVIAAALIVVLISRNGSNPDTTPGNGIGAIATNTASSNSTAITHPPTATTGPANTPVPTDTPIPTSTPIPPPPGVVLLQSNQQNSFNGWAPSGPWKILNGALVNDGSGSANDNCGKGTTLLAPITPSTPDVRIDMTIQFPQNYNGNDIGFVVREGQDNNQLIGYSAYVDRHNNGIQSINHGSCDQISYNYADFLPNNTVHTMRFDIKGANMKFYVDGSLDVSVSDARYLNAGQLGIFVNHEYVQITNITITSL